MKYIISSFIAMSLLFSATAVFAQGSNGGSSGGDGVPIVNPLGGKIEGGDVIGYFSGRLGGLLNVMFGLIAVVSLIPIVFGGIQLIMSRGSSDMVQKGKNALFWGVVGLVIAFSGIVFFNFLLGVLIE